MASRTLLARLAAIQLFCLLHLGALVGAVHLLTCLRNRRRPLRTDYEHRRSGVDVLGG